MSESRVVGHKRACTHVQLNTEWAVGQLLMFEFYVKTTFRQYRVHISRHSARSRCACGGSVFFFFGTNACLNKPNHPSIRLKLSKNR